MDKLDGIGEIVRSSGANVTINWNTGTDDEEDEEDSDDTSDTEDESSQSAQSAPF